MPIQGLPTFTAPGAELATMPDEIRRMLLEKAQQEHTQGQNQREQEMQPLNMEEKRAGIGEKNALAEWYKRRPATGAGGAGSVGQKDEMYFQSLVAKDNPNLKPEQIYEAANALRNGQTTLSDGTQINPLSPASEGIYNTMLKRQNTAQGLNQQRFAATTEALIQNSEPNARAAFDYSGMLGKGKGSIDKVGQIFGIDTPKYNQYVQFTRVDVPTIAGEVMRELGVNATDTQKKMYIDLVNPISWDQNPKAAHERWKHFIKTAKTVGKTISSSPSKIHAGLNKPEGEETEKPEKVRRKYNIETGKFE